jgi:cell division protein FtsQ
MTEAETEVAAERRAHRPRDRQEEDRRPAPSTVRAQARSQARSRRRYLMRRWVVLGVVLAVLGLGYLLLFTSVLGVGSVEVSGAQNVSADAVRAAAAIEPGTPMARLDTDEVAARVATLPRVFSVTVERSWPSTVEIFVTERSPVAMVTAGDGVHLVDATGLDYAVVKQAPAGLPKLALSTVHPDDPATRAAVSVLGAIPHQLATQVVEVTASTPGNVRLILADGRTIKWGSAENSERKAAVLAALLTRPGTIYDVVTPDFPTVS